MTPDHIAEIALIEVSRLQRSALAMPNDELDLLAAAKLALEVAENWIHDQLDGTRELDGALKTLDPVRRAIAAAEATDAAR